MRLNMGLDLRTLPLYRADLPGENLDVAFHGVLAGVFLARPNRFLTWVRVSRKRVKAACRDPGRLRELLVPGRRVLVAKAEGRARKTRFTLTLVRHEGVWVSLIPDLANRIFSGALEREGVAGLRGVRILRREVPSGRSRIDFVLLEDGIPVWTEVKSATLVVGGRALFPDAPTLRGKRHLEELTRLCRAGAKALAVFVVQRPDAHSIAPNWGTDPDFARALLHAREAGVRILAFRCAVGPRGCTLLGPIPVEQGGG